MKICPALQHPLLRAARLDPIAHSAHHPSHFWTEFLVQNKHPQMVQHLQEWKNTTCGFAACSQEENWPLPGQCGCSESTCSCRQKGDSVAQTGLAHSTIHTILCKDLKLKKKCARFIPYVLTPRHLCLCFDISSMMLHLVRECHGLLKTIVTVDESWIHTYDLLSRAQSSEWLAPGEERPQVAHLSHAGGKVLLVSFFNWKGLVHYEMLHNTTVNTTRFLGILSHLQQALAAHQPRRRNQLHMDNAMPHNAHNTKMKLLSAGSHQVPHPPYSSYLSPNDFWFYPHLKKSLKGRYFCNLDELEAAVHTEIGQIPAQEYQHAILDSWPMHWAHCVFRDAGYFEGSN